MASLPLTNLISQVSSSALDQKVVVAMYGDGYEQRAAIGLNSMSYKWEISMTYLNLTDRNTMNAFYMAHGRVVSFDWTPPNGTAGKYRFDSALNETNVSLYYNYTFSVVQVFEA